MDSSCLSQRRIAASLSIARGEASQIFDLVEESLDRVAVFVKRLAETVSLRAV